eukprot:gb/GECG01003082.1/.p1 GENE.gb/GECG01003082.1/~~gb/GECG01003082.1/.p1  ORF type:complete len:747 (+),score=85.42 gb/GECG01003082.1/:1-2241(+)
MDAVGRDDFLLAYTVAYSLQTVGKELLETREDHDQLILGIGYRFTVENWTELTPSFEHVVACIEEDCGAKTAARVKQESDSFLESITNVNDVYDAIHRIIQPLAKNKENQQGYSVTKGSILGSFQGIVVQKVRQTHFAGFQKLLISLKGGDDTNKDERNVPNTKRRIGKLINTYLKECRKSPKGMHKEDPKWDRLHDLVLQAPSDLPNVHLARLGLALKNDDYSSAVNAIHSFYDFPIEGVTLRTPGSFNRNGGGTFDPSFRNKFGTDYHYCLIHIASVQLWFGYLGAAEDCLAGSIISAQLRGDEVGATIGMAFLSQLQHDAWEAKISNGILRKTGSQHTSVTDVFSPFPSVYSAGSQIPRRLMRRCRQRACELGLCRLHTVLAKTAGEEEPLKFSIRSWRYSYITRTKQPGADASTIHPDSLAFEEISCATHFALDSRLPMVFKRSESQFSKPLWEHLVQYETHANRGRHHIGLPPHFSATSLLSALLSATVSVVRPNGTEGTVEWNSLDSVSQTCAQDFHVTMDAVDRLNALVEESDCTRDILSELSEAWVDRKSSPGSKISMYKEIFNNRELNYDFTSSRLRIKAGQEYVRLLLEELESIAGMTNSQPSGRGVEHEVFPVLEEAFNLSFELNMTDLVVQCIVLKGQALSTLPDGGTRGVEHLQKHLDYIYCFATPALMKQTLEIMCCGKVGTISDFDETSRPKFFRSFTNCLNQFLRNDETLNGGLSAAVPLLKYEDIFHTK